MRGSTLLIFACHGHGITHSIPWHPHGIPWRGMASYKARESTELFSVVRHEVSQNVIVFYVDALCLEHNIDKTRTPLTNWLFVPLDEVG